MDHILDFRTYDSTKLVEITDHILDFMTHDYIKHSFKDKTYDYTSIRQDLKNKNICDHIPVRKSGTISQTRKDGQKSNLFVLS